ncbi:MAG: PQQ-dependent sugar dehydrogenase [Myxococcales bacterium]|nr:PQQ-dependent sugar dehydrogenase [Myxococcales bacterium]
MKARCRILAALIFVAAPLAHAAVADPNFTESVFLAGSASSSSITGIAWAPDGSNRLFVARKAGQIRIVKNGALLATPFATVTGPTGGALYTSSECGLTGIALDPAFTTNGYVWVFATVSASEQQIIRYSANGDAGTNKTIVVSGLPTAGVNHDGGAIGFGPDGKLYWGIGDLGNGTGVDQNLTSMAAKIGRAKLDGTVPNDNPFFDGSGPNADFIWARGARNPFTFTFQPSTGALWVNVVGTSYEQVFVVKKGEHLGYNDYENNQPAGYLTPVIKYRTNGTDTRTITGSGAVRTSNVATFTTSASHGFRRGEKITVSGAGDASFNGSFFVTSVPSATSFTVAQTAPDATSGGGSAVTLNQGGCITGGTFLTGSAASAAYRGNFFYGDFNSGRLMRAVLGAGNSVDGVDYFGSGIANAVDLAEGPDGALYYASYGSGTVYRAAFNPTGQNVIVSTLNPWVMEGGNVVVTVRLAQAPAANVSVSVARTSGDADLSVSGGSLTFTPADWSTPKGVVIAAAEDADSDNDAAGFEVTSAGLPTHTIGAMAIDNDEVDLMLSTSSLTLAEGASAPFTVRLSGPPAASVTVNVARSAGDADITVSAGASLTFDGTNYSVPQTVTVSAAEDADSTNDTATLTLSATGFASRTVAVTAFDNESSAPVITTTPITTATVGAPYTYDVNAVGSGTITYALTASPAGMTIDPSSGVISWTPTAPGSVNVAVRASNGIQPDATQAFTVVVRADAPPTATIVKPANNDVVSGATADWFGDGTDDAGTVKAEFSVDGAVAYTDTNTTGRYRYGGAYSAWDTTKLPEGAHTLRMTVYDTAGQTGFAEVSVVVKNQAPADAGGPTEGPPPVKSTCGCGAGSAPLGLAILALARALGGRRKRRP